MKHCNYCNVDVEDQKVHCPLCGKCIDEEKVKTGIVNHSDIYPDYKYKSSHRYKILACKILSLTLFIISLLCMGIDLFVNSTISFSLIVLVSFIYLHFILLRPLRKNMPLETMLMIISFFTILFVIFLELYTKTFGWGINIAVPSVLAGISLLGFIFMIATRFNDTDMIKPILINLLLNIVLFILLAVFKQPILISVISLFFNLAVVLFVLLFRFKTASKSITKEFRF